MKLLLKQTKQDLFTAEFEIFENNNIVGRISLQGNLGSMEASLKGNFYDTDFSLEYVNKILTGSSKKFRPYNILENNNIVGEIFNTKFKKNVFSKYNYEKCIHNNKEYNLYSIGLGSTSVITVYCDDIQTAQIEKSPILYDDFHNYTIYTIDKENAYISTIMCCYLYILGAYKPGVKVTKSVQKFYYKTTNKDLLSKYNPDWIKQFKNL